jgi:hypothetical protein
VKRVASTTTTNETSAFARGAEIQIVGPLAVVRVTGYLMCIIDASSQAGSVATVRTDPESEASFALTGSQGIWPPKGR